MKRATVKVVKDHLRHTGASSVGDTETLAGIDTTSRTERMAVWGGFDYASLSTQEQVNRAMHNCHALIVSKVNKGLLSLWPRMERA